MKTFPARLQKGFMLVELLVVIAIIAILSSIVIVTINPTKQLGEARNAQRHADVNTILNAVYQYTIDNNGFPPEEIGDVPMNICRSGVNIDCMHLVNLNSLTGTYVVTIPADPLFATEKDTKYAIANVNGRITVSAPFAEQNEVITVSR